MEKSCLIIENLEKNSCFQTIDFKTGFLLSNIRFFKSTLKSPELEKIVKVTEIPIVNFSVSKLAQSIFFVPSLNHLSTDWIILVENLEIFKDANMTSYLVKQLSLLKIKTVRVLIDLKSDASIRLVSSLKSSFDDIEIVLSSQ